MKVYVAGHSGLVGSAICRRLAGEQGVELVTATRQQVDLTNQIAAARFMQSAKPDAVILAAAKVGGILANASQPVQFLTENLAIQSNVIQSAFRHGVKRLLFLGSTCIYPRNAYSPLLESDLLSGPLEPTNEAYAVAKLTGVAMCNYYRKQYGVTYHTLMPCNLYGRGDNYDPETSHVLPALIRRFHKAKMRGDGSVTIWGSGKPRREFLHVDDLAEAVWIAMQAENPPNVMNVGSGSDLTIRELAELVADVVEFRGEIEHDLTKPDGVPRKLADIQKIMRLGWRPKIPLRDGIARTYAAYLHGLLSENLVDTATA